MYKFIGLLIVALLTISLGACSSSNSSQGAKNNSENGKTSVTSKTANTVKKVNSDTEINPSCTFKSHNSKETKNKSS